MLTIYKLNGNVMKSAVTGHWLIKTPVLPEVTIGTQTWTSVNLALDDGQGGIEKRTVNYGQGEVVEYYYNWYAAMRLAEAIDGWHLPSKAEYDAWGQYVGWNRGVPLTRSTYGWYNDMNGTNETGFNAFPAGYIYSNGETLDNYSMSAHFWLSNSVDEGSAMNFNLSYSTDQFPTVGPYGGVKTNYHSVRLIKDA